MTEWKKLRDELPPPDMTQRMTDDEEAWVRMERTMFKVKEKIPMPGTEERKKWSQKLKEEEKCREYYEAWLATEKQITIRVVCILTLVALVAVCVTLAHIFGG